jgi:hypothetical protein
MRCIVSKSVAFPVLGEGAELKISLDTSAQGELYHLLKNTKMFMYYNVQLIFPTDKTLTWMMYQCSARNSAHIAVAKFTILA